jgi:hypothetical protein
MRSTVRVVIEKKDSQRSKDTEPTQSHTGTELTQTRYVFNKVAPALETASDTKRTKIADAERIPIQIQG